MLQNQFSFLCDKTEEDLDKTASEDLLFCRHCREHVHRVRTEEQWHENAQRGHCVLALTSTAQPLLARPRTGAALYLTLEAAHGGSKFGPYSKDTEVVIGSEKSAHILIPAAMGHEPAHARLQCKDGHVVFKQCSILAGVRYRRSQHDETQELVDGTALFDGDQITLVGTHTVSFQLQFAAPPPPVPLTGRIAPRPPTGRARLTQTLQDKWQRFQKWWSR